MVGGLGTTAVLGTTTKVQERKREVSIESPIPKSHPKTHKSSAYQGVCKLLNFWVLMRSLALQSARLS